mmetsp:Transcript_35644/g.57257  ORF Transcript_35644/g.57257 Transcript_35644/m.57257 type:complete len:316 (+) Transcript_35644:853-1800(+)
MPSVFDFHCRLSARYWPSALLHKININLARLLVWPRVLRLSRGLSWICRWNCWRHRFHHRHRRRRCTGSSCSRSCTGSFLFFSASASTVITTTGSGARSTWNGWWSTRTSIRHWTGRFHRLLLVGHRRWHCGTWNSRRLLRCLLFWRRRLWRSTRNWRRCLLCRFGFAFAFHWIGRWSLLRSHWICRWLLGRSCLSWFGRHHRLWGLRWFGRSSFFWFWFRLFGGRLLDRLWLWLCCLLRMRLFGRVLAWRARRGDIVVDDGSARFLVLLRSDHHFVEDALVSMLLFLYILSNQFLSNLRIEDRAFKRDRLRAAL